MALRRPSIHKDAVNETRGAGIVTRTVAVCGCILPATCGTFPAVATMEGPGGPPPPLLPLDGLLPPSTTQTDQIPAQMARTEPFRPRTGPFGVP